MGATSEPKGRGITITIKYGKGYEDTGAVFHGLVEDVRADIVTFFGMARESETSLTLSDLVVNATSLAHGVGNVAAGLGGMVIASESTSSASPAATTRPDPWAQAGSGSDAGQPTAAEPAASEPHPLLALIGQVQDVRALERLWAENQDAFADPTVMAAWKAKGRALNQAR